jgi:hypothetical protein
MKLLMSTLLAATLWAGASFGTQAARADEVVVSPTVTANVQNVQWRRYRAYPRYYGGYYGGGYYPYRYYSYRPYYGNGGYVYSPWGGVYFGW